MGASDSWTVSCLEAAKRHVGRGTARRLRPHHGTSKQVGLQDATERCVILAPRWRHGAQMETRPRFLHCPARHPGRSCGPHRAVIAEVPYKLFYRYQLPRLTGPPEKAARSPGFDGRLRRPSQTSRVKSAARVLRVHAWRPRALSGLTHSPPLRTGICVF